MKLGTILETLTTGQLEKLYDILKPQDPDCYTKLCTQTKAVYAKHDSEKFEFLNFHKLTVDKNKGCLIDTRKNVVINLNPCYYKPSSITCVLRKQNKFQDICAKYPNVVTPTSRFERQPVNIQYAIVTNGEIVKSKLRHML